MDLTFQTNEGIFNCRVCAVILREEKLLVMQDQRSPYYYLPGGRVRLHETLEQAILREVREELGINAKINRPLWLNQGFFTEDVSGETYHELCLYFLMDISETNLAERGETFLHKEGSKTHTFRWLPLESLKEAYLYPIFIKDKIFSLPSHLTLQAEFE